MECGKPFLILIKVRSIMLKEARPDVYNDLVHSLQRK